MGAKYQRQCQSDRKRKYQRESLEVLQTRHSGDGGDMEGIKSNNITLIWNLI